MELQDYLMILRKRWLTIAITAPIVVGVAALVTLAQPKEYASSTQFFVSVSGAADTSQLQQGSAFTQQRVKSYAQLLKTPRALGPVVDELGDDTRTGDISDSLRVTTPPDTVLLDVTVIDPSPTRAQAIARAIGETFPEVVAEIERPSDESASSPVKVSLVQPASVDSTPVSPVPARNLALGGVVGLFLGVAFAILRHRFDTTLRTGRDVAEVTDEPVIGTVYHDPTAPKEPLIVRSGRASPRAEAFRALRTNLMFVNATTHPRTILLTSSIPSEGKTTTLANLAVTLSESGARVCLIEGDLRRPRLLDYLRLEGSAGLTDVLIERATLDDVLQPYGSDGLAVIGAGTIPPNPSELLASAAMSQVLTELASRYDYVLTGLPSLYQRSPIGR